MNIVAGAQVLSLESMPIIDLKPWLQDDHGKNLVADQVQRVCREVGFLYIKNHGVSPEIVEAALQAARDFFSLEEKVKLRVRAQGGGYPRGYIPLRGQGRGKGDLKEAFDFGPEYSPKAKVDVGAMRSSTPYWELKYAHNLWPHGLDDFRRAVEEYLAALIQLGRTIFEILAVGFGLPADYFSDKLALPNAVGRLLHYPPQEPQDDQSMGISAHCDVSCFTILPQSEVGGIQVQNRTGNWVLARSIPGTFVVLIGEMMARWTNDVLRATPHRVINIHGKERYSLPLFFGPNYETIISCLDPCQGTDRPARYAPVVAGDYLVQRIAGEYGDQPPIV